MQALKARQVRLDEEESGRCPLCDQELALEHLTAVIAQIQVQGEALAEAYRRGLAELREAQAGLSEAQKSLDALNRVERELRAAESSKTTAQTLLRDIERALEQWHTKGAPRLSAVESRLNEGSIAPEAQTRLAEFDAALEALKYDGGVHAAARQRAEKLAHAQREHQLLGEAQAALRPLETAIEDLTRQIAEQRLQIDDLTVQLTAAKTKLEQLGPAPVVDLIAAEGELNRLREAEVQAAKSVGAAEQVLRNLDLLRKQTEQLSALRQEKTQVIRQLKKLERALGRNGVQALLVEQALPVVQDSANELLDKLTESGMRVRFETQRKLKSRDAKTETLDIHIGDGAGERPYEMFSGGEAFRINFAIRIALSRLLAQRVGARLQTLVIDEGFGSQDPEGRKGLLRAINAVRTDFAKILVITHIDDLKDAFPVRIEVTKEPGGSQVRVT
jgi:exonuclease SbcC